MTQVKLKKGEGRTVNAGGLWIYDNEIDEILPEGGQMPEPGDPVRVLAFNEYPLGVGFYNPASKIRIRLLSRDADADITSREFYAKRIHDAVEYRRHILEDLDSCRLIFGEADYLPGLTVDKFSDTLVLQSLWLGTDRYKEMIADLLKAELAALGITIRGVYERSDAKVRLQEGLELRTGFIGEPFDTLVTIVENGVKYHVDVAEGQKTGFFLDQKFNRQAVARLAKGHRVLDCFTHTGSFALNAAKGGAEYVEGWDISAAAVEMAKENARRNGLEHIADFQQHDVFDRLTELAERAHKPFDFIILDPPAFTKSRKTADRAERGYREINYLAMKLLPRGGYLATASCSHFMPNERFVQMLRTAARDANVQLRQIEVRQQGPDHPILWNVPETDYLKFYLFQVV